MYVVPIQLPHLLKGEAPNKKQRHKGNHIRKIRNHLHKSRNRIPEWSHSEPPLLTGRWLQWKEGDSHWDSGNPRFYFIQSKEVNGVNDADEFGLISSNRWTSTAENWSNNTLHSLYSGRAARYPDKGKTIQYACSSNGVGEEVKIQDPSICWSDFNGNLIPSPDLRPPVASLVNDDFYNADIHFIEKGED